MTRNDYQQTPLKGPQTFESVHQPPTFQKCVVLTAKFLVISGSEMYNKAYVSAVLLIV